MKKNLFVLILLSFVLVGCKNNEEKKIPSDWSVKYAIEEYNKDYEGYEVIAYTVEEVKIYDNTLFEEWADEHDYLMYKVTITNSSGKDTIYNVIIAFKYNFYSTITYTYPNLKESKIYVINIEMT